jgi:hypothetical protein
MKLGISGYLTRASITLLTPLLLLAALIVGSLALLGLPREEEPQISVPMVDIMITANGYKAGDAIPKAFLSRSSSAVGSTTWQS